MIVKYLDELYIVTLAHFLKSRLVRYADFCPASDMILGIFCLVFVWNVRRMFVRTPNLRSVAFLCCGHEIIP